MEAAVRPFRCPFPGELALRILSLPLEREDACGIWEGTRHILSVNPADDFAIVPVFRERHLWDLQA
ncbi:Uncharacterised protein [Mycobacteroides abscessus subsp. abscessus]|nr:Uncharacterised protein [Mycobacteroides abscessus subsp. abscessus]